MRILQSAIGKTRRTVHFAIGKKHAVENLGVGIPKNAVERIEIGMKM